MRCTYPKDPGAVCYTGYLEGLCVHFRYTPTWGVKIAHGAEEPPEPGMPASLHGSGVPVAKSSHCLPSSKPAASSCSCAARFTAARTPSRMVHERSKHTICVTRRVIIC
jgi:hypothetical protein